MKNIYSLKYLPTESAIDLKVGVPCSKDQPIDDDVPQNLIILVEPLFQE